MIYAIALQENFMMFSLIIPCPTRSSFPLSRPFRPFVLEK